MTGAGGLPTRLFTLFQGPHWTLLGHEVDDAPAPAPRTGLRIHVIGGGGDILDTGGHVHSAYGLSSGQSVLVRPDGYFAAVVGTDDLGSLATYLDAVGVRPVPMAQPHHTGTSAGMPAPNPSAAPAPGVSTVGSVAPPSSNSPAPNASSTSSRARSSATCAVSAGKGRPPRSSPARTSPSSRSRASPGWRPTFVPTPATEAAGTTSSSSVTPAPTRRMPHTGDPPHGASTPCAAAHHGARP
ncbi:hypothetical protein [Streptomyces mirabilis]